MRTGRRRWLAPVRTASTTLIPCSRKPLIADTITTPFWEVDGRAGFSAYGQAVDRKADRSDPTGPLNHTLRVFLIDRAGNIRNIYSSGTLDPRLVLADVRTLLMEKAQP